MTCIPITQLKKEKNHCNSWTPLCVCPSPNHTSRNTASLDWRHIKKGGVRPAGNRLRRPFSCKHVLPFMNKGRMAQIQEPERCGNYSRNGRHLPDWISELLWTSASFMPPFPPFFWAGISTAVVLCPSQLQCTGDRTCVSLVSQIYRLRGTVLEPHPGALFTPRSDSDAEILDFELM